MSLYMQIVGSLTTGTTYYPYANIVVQNANGNNIIAGNTNSFALTPTQQGSISVALSGTMTTPYAPTSTYPLFITFRLRTFTLYAGDYLLVDFGSWVLDPATNGVQVFKYQVSGNIYWIPSTATLSSGNIYRVPVYSNYNMVAGSQITLWVDTFAPSTYYGAKVTASQWNTFKIYAYQNIQDMD
jgi:hypothetical protein